MGLAVRQIAKVMQIHHSRVQRVLRIPECVVVPPPDEGNIST
jgi:hypothetical protein